MPAWNYTLMGVILLYCSHTQGGKILAFIFMGIALFISGYEWLKRRTK